MTQWFYASVEYTQWGLNASTIGSLGTIVFTAIEGWGLRKQNQNIWSHNSGASVSVTLISFLMFFLFAFGMYGYYVKSISMLVNGIILGALHVPILCGLCTYKKFTSTDKWSIGLSSFMVPAMLILPWKDGTYLFIAFCASLSGVTQAWEIFREKDSGVVDIRLLLTYFGSTLFWVIYATAIELKPLILMTWITLIILAVIIALWQLYRKPPVAASTQTKRL